MLKVPGSIVSCDWLCENLHQKNLIILDATIPKVTVKKHEDVLHKNRIPFSRFFDIKKVFSDQDATYPNTMLAPKEFEEKAQELGINMESCIVVYDTHGIYSSPRAWWMFKTMGFHNIAVLDGGLPKWISKEYKVEEQNNTPYSKSNFLSKPNKEMLINSTIVLESLKKGDKSILDARSLGRYKGLEPEPRKNVRSGHIPTSKSLGYSSVINGFELKSKDQLKKIYQSTNTENKPMIFSCGTGITACVLALGASVAGYKDFAVYDGSWTEWGSELKNPIEL